MLSGSIKKHNEPFHGKPTAHNSSAMYDDWFQDTSSDSLTDKYRRLAEAEETAKKNGFIVGAKVKRAYGNIDQVGEIIGYELTVGKGFSATGVAQPLRVRWQTAAGMYTSEYSESELILLGA